MKKIYINKKIKIVNRKNYNIIIQSCNKKNIIILKLIKK